MLLGASLERRLGPRRKIADQDLLHIDHLRYRFDDLTGATPWSPDCHGIYRRLVRDQPDGDEHEPECAGPWLCDDECADDDEASIEDAGAAAVAKFAALVQAGPRLFRRRYGGRDYDALKVIAEPSWTSCSWTCACRDSTGSRRPAACARTLRSTGAGGRGDDLRTGRMPLRCAPAPASASFLAKGARPERLLHRIRPVARRRHLGPPQSRPTSAGSSKLSVLSRASYASPPPTTVSLVVHGAFDAAAR